MSPLRLGMLISGRGSTMRSVAQAIRDASLDAEIGIVISNNPGAPGNEIARSYGLHLEVVAKRDGRSRIERHQTMLELLQAAGVELVVCAGFDEILTPALTQAFDLRMINIHPSLLPAFGGGLHAIRDALDHGAKVTGCTVHYVTAELDNGPILVQRPVPVLEDDTEDSLAARVLVQEHLALPEAIGLIASGRVAVQGRRVHIASEPAATIR